MDRAAGACVLAILRYGNEYDGPFFGDAIPLAAAGHRMGVSPGLAAEILARNDRMVVDHQRRLVWERGERTWRKGPPASYPTAPSHGWWSTRRRSAGDAGRKGRRMN